MRVSPGFFLCTPLVEHAIPGHPLSHLGAIMLQKKKKKTQANFSPLHVDKFLFTSVIYKKGSWETNQRK